MLALSRSMRSRTFLLALSLGVAAVVAAGCASAPPLVEPPPIVAAPTPAQTRTAILRTLLQSNWTIESERAGEVVAKFSSPKWNMVVAIDYGDQVSIRYVSSENLDYDASKGLPTIHPGYNKRTQSLANRIAKEIAMARAMSDLPAVAAPPPDKAPAE